jgi:THO complex subunit 3
MNTKSTNIREIAILEHHRSIVESVTFHPSEPNLLCTATNDRTIQFWDVRSRGPGRCLSKVDLKSKTNGYSARSVEWLGGNANGRGNIHDSMESKYFVVTESNNNVYIYDMRKLQATGAASQRSSSTSTNGQIPIQSFEFDSLDHVVNNTQLSPSGTYLVSSVRNKGDGMGCLIAYPWKNNNSSSSNAQEPTKISSLLQSGHAKTFVAHTGQINSFQFSPNGKLLTTGGTDTLAGLWDVSSMVCTSTITRRYKPITSVSYSYDSKLFACCSTEEDGVDISMASTGEFVCNVNLNRPNSRLGGGYGGGAEQIAFHPKSYLLACARNGNRHQLPEVTFAKIPETIRR